MIWYLSKELKKEEMIMGFLLFFAICDSFFFQLDIKLFPFIFLKRLNEIFYQIYKLYYIIKIEIVKIEYL